MRTSDADWLRHPLSLLGAALATVSGVLVVAIFAAGFLGFSGGPYLGLFAYVALPTLLVLALLLIPLGMTLDRRRRARLAASVRVAGRAPHRPVAPPGSRPP